MIIPVTSFADLFHKIELDNRYKWLVIYAYLNFKHEKIELITYQIALDWMIDWLNKNVDVTYTKRSYFPTCNPMVEYLNKGVYDINNDKKFSLPPIL